MSRTAKIACLSGSVLLLVMAILHGSGYSLISDAIVESNASAFLNAVVPAVFIHASIHLTVLAAFGILALFLSHDAPKLLALLAVAVMADAVLAFTLGALLPGALLVAAALSFAIAAGTPSRSGRRDDRGKRSIHVEEDRA